MAVSPRPKLTYEDYLAFPDDGVRRELVDGEIYVTPSPTMRHQDVGGRIYRLFADHLDGHGGGVVVYDFDVKLSDVRIVRPDIVFVSEERLAMLGQTCMSGPPSLVVEVVSDARRDRVQKRDWYAEHDVPEYWVADPDADRFEVHRLHSGRYPKPQIVEAGETISALELPGLAIDVAWVFRR